ncbi:MAG: sensor histidine kinase [Hyphomicrobiaceae bacterium]|nr:sensor histidine kinase [Hyphomicrobiaceae bacterium]
MKLNSLAFRLFRTAAVWAVLVLPLAGFTIDWVHKQDIYKTFDARLSQLLTLNIAFSTDQGGPEPKVPRNVGEPLFELAHSGWYWQITPLGQSPGKRLVSASLTSEQLRLPSTLGKKPDRYNIIWDETAGPVGEPLRIAETLYNAGDDENPRFYSFIVAGNLEFAETRVTEFRVPLAFALALAGLGLVLSTFLQVRYGLQPLRVIERRLAAIRSGEARHLEGALPAEIAPLQTELNALIQSNEDIIERARTQVGNLAHALKTPLAVITNEVAADTSTSALKVAEQAGIMRDQVQYYLDRARMAARVGSIGRVTDVRPVAQSIARALERIYQERRLDIVVDCPSDARFHGERQDLEEMLGNLADNACKWARSAVRVMVRVDAAHGNPGQRRLHLSIDDDGPGLTLEQRAQAIKRGRRLDESKPGSGLGHSIVADLASSYRGQFKLEESDLGGLSARLDLPAP